MESLAKHIIATMHLPMRSLQREIFDNLGGGNEFLGSTRIKIVNEINKPIIIKIKMNVVNKIEAAIMETI